MQRTCQVCGRDYEAKRKDSTACSATCRSRRRHRSTTGSAGGSGGNPLVAATRAELEAAGKVDTMLGQLALALAGRLRSEMTGVSALSRELRAVTAAAVGSATPGAPAAGAGDAVDELRARRNAKRSG